MIISLVLDKQGEQDDWSQWRRNSDFQLNFTEDKVSIWSKLENLSNTSTMYRELYLMIFACIWYVPSNIQKGYEECENWTLFVFLVSFLYFHRYFDYILYSRGVEILPPRSIFTKVVHSLLPKLRFSLSFMFGLRLTKF